MFGCAHGYPSHARTKLDVGGGTKQSSSPRRTKPDRAKRGVSGHKDHKKLLKKGLIKKFCYICLQVFWFVPTFQFAWFCLVLPGCLTLPERQKPWAREGISLPCAQFASHEAVCLVLLSFSGNQKSRVYNDTGRELQMLTVQAGVSAGQSRAAASASQGVASGALI